jgi:hypothetical protein
LTLIWSTISTTPGMLAASSTASNRSKPDLISPPRTTLPFALSTASLAADHRPFAVVPISQAHPPA